MTFTKVLFDLLSKLDLKKPYVTLCIVIGIITYLYMQHNNIFYKSTEPNLEEIENRITALEYRLIELENIVLVVDNKTNEIVFILRLNFKSEIQKQLSKKERKEYIKADDIVKLIEICNLHKDILKIDQDCYDIKILNTRTE